MYFHRSATLQPLNGVQCVKVPKWRADLMMWCRKVQFGISNNFRSRDRKAEATLTVLDQPQALTIDSASDGLNPSTEIELLALSQTRTRVLVSFDLRAKTLTAHLLVQSLKLAKTKVTKRFNGRVLGFAEEIEDRYRRDA
jgi:hypothetical protein